MSELQRIRADLTRAKTRVAEMERGERGVRPAADWRQPTELPVPTDRRAYENQLNAMRKAVSQFENEYLLAMLAEGKWSAAAIIEAMQK